MKAVKWSMVAIALTLAIPAVAAADKPAVPAVKKGKKYWGKLNWRRTGWWARKRVMRKGYLIRLINKRVVKKHPAYAKLLAETLKGVNAQLGKCKGFWPNFRLALANLIAGARKGAGTALAGVMKPSLDAIRDGCAKVGQGGKKAVIDALKAARAQLKGMKVKAVKRLRRFRRRIRSALAWMRKGNLWRKAKKHKRWKHKRKKAPKAD